MMFRCVLLGLGLGACGGRDAGPHDAGGLPMDGGSGHDGAFVSECHVPPMGTDAPIACSVEAPPLSFDPVVQWEWTPPGGGAEHAGSQVIPLVGNFTDDNGDGSIDLCDVPDLLVNLTRVMRIDDFSARHYGELHLLSGDDGHEHFVFEAEVHPHFTPAFGDIDGDLLPEVVTLARDWSIVAFEHDGSLKWRSAPMDWADKKQMQYGATALYDLEGDGDVEIIAGDSVLDARGRVLWRAPALPTDAIADYQSPTPFAADLDGNGMLEVIFGRTVHRHDGSIWFSLDHDEPVGSPNVDWAHAAIADLDGDGTPELAYTSPWGLRVVEVDGTPHALERTHEGYINARPSVIADMNGDGRVDMGISTQDHVSVITFDGDYHTLWSAPVVDVTGSAAATAFDFLGDGTKEAIYVDEHHAFVFDGVDGAMRMQIERRSLTLIEYPIVADVDNDGSAEIAITAQGRGGGWDADDPVVIVIRDASDRWVPTRRIWNQHAYHVTNVLEDGRIPAHPVPSWQSVNTFRANAQIEGAAICDPLI